MGLDCKYQALPEECELLERSKREPEFGEMLSMAPWHQETLEMLSRSGGVPAEFAREVLRLRERHPGLEGRHYSLDRKWDMLHYLLSEARREDRPHDDWGSAAILGASALPEHLSAGQGVPLRYSGREAVRDLVTRMEGLWEADLRQAYVPERMQERAVYKFRADHADAETWQWLWRYFEGLRAFLRQAADAGEGVLVIIY